MMWIVSNMHYFYYPWSYFLENQKKLGADKIDFFGGMPHIWIDHYAWYGSRAIRESVKEQGMNLVLFTPKPYNYCIFAPEEPHGAMSEGYYKNCISAAEELGVSNMAISLTGGYRDYSPDLLREKGKKRLAGLGRLAAEHNINILLEAGETENFLFQTIQEARMFFQSESGRNFKLSLNIRTMSKAGELLSQWMEAFPRELQYIRFHNELALKEIQRTEYKGMWGVSVSDDSHWDDPAETDRRLYDCFNRGASDDKTQ